MILKLTSKTKESILEILSLDYLSLQFTHNDIPHEIVEDYLFIDCISTFTINDVIFSKVSIDINFDKKTIDIFTLHGHNYLAKSSFSDTSYIEIEV